MDFRGVRYFRRLGAQAEAALIVDAQSARDTSLVAQLRNADVVYFTGGDPVYLLETMRDSPAWRAALDVLDRGGVIAGSSAGAMMCGGQMWAPDDGWREGLGLVPYVAVIPHHATLAARWNAERMRITLPSGVTLVGIDEATALVGSGQNWQVLGPGKVVVYDAESPSVFISGQSVLL